MKQCATCKKNKALRYFSKDRGKKSGYSSYCKLCMRLRDRQYYRTHKATRYAQYRARRLKIVKENTVKLWQYLQTHPCIDCGERDLIVLQFDHLRDKTRTVARLLNEGISWQRILEEIDKCQVRCANCHTRKTASEQNWAKYLPIKKNVALIISKHKEKIKL